MLLVVMQILPPHRRHHDNKGAPLPLLMLLLPRLLPPLFPETKDPPFYSHCRLLPASQHAPQLVFSLQKVLQCAYSKV